MKKTAALLLAMAATHAAADNQQGFYLGGNFGMVEFHDGSVFDEDVSEARFRALELVGGYKYNSALGLEARVGAGFDERNEVVDGSDYELKIDRYESIYYRPELANKEAKLYGLLGYSRLKRSATTAGSESSDSESGFSYGVGIGFVINPEFNFNIEYRRLMDKDNAEVDAASLGFDYRF